MRVPGCKGIFCVEPYRFEDRLPQALGGLFDRQLREHMFRPIWRCCSHDAPDDLAQIHGVEELLAGHMSCSRAGNRFCRIDANHGHWVRGVHCQYGRALACHGVIEQTGPFGDLLEDLQGTVIIMHARDLLVIEINGDMSGAAVVSCLR